MIDVKNDDPNRFTVMVEYDQYVFDITGQDAQVLVDTLAAYGITNGKTNGYMLGELDATKRHLADMRRLVLLENEKGEVES